MFRVLHIVSYLTVGSGVMNVIMNYYRNIDRNMIQFDFLFFEKGTYLEPNYIDEIHSLGGRTFFIEKPSISNSLVSFTRFNRFFKDHSKRYLAVHLHELYLIHFIKLFTTMYGVRNLIANAHSSKFSENKILAFRNRLLCWGINYSATHLFACSKSAAECYYGTSIKNINGVYYLHNAIDLDRFRFCLKDRIEVRKLYSVENKIVIGHIGRMVPVKNHFFILEQFYRLRQKNKNTVLFLVGEGPLRECIESKIKSLKLTDSVLLLGIRNDIGRLLSAFDYFWLPSLHEGLPVTGIEAQANGVRSFFSDNVTEEVIISKSAKRIPLKSWDICINECSQKYSRLSYNDNNMRDYDIKLETIKLMNKYLDMTKN